jgi:hypothetical protein
MFKSLSASLVLRGILAIAVGITALAWPEVTVLALVILFAVYAFIAAGRTRRAPPIEPTSQGSRHGRDRCPPDTPVRRAAASSPASTASRRPTFSTSPTWKSCCSPGSVSTR